MIKRIFKYTLDAVPTQTVHMPQGAEILRVATQNEFPCIWVEVSPNALEESRVFHIVTTGDSFDVRGLQYIGTFDINGWFVGHIYEQVDSSIGGTGGLRAARDFGEIRRENLIENRPSIQKIQEEEEKEREKAIAKL